MLICAGIVSATFVADFSFVLALSQICIVVLLISLLLIELSRAVNFLRRVVIGLLLVSLGVFWHLSWANNRLSERLPETLEGETLQVEGVVIGLPERSLIAQQFQFQILHAPSGFFPR